MRLTALLRRLLRRGAPAPAEALPGMHDPEWATHQSDYVAASTWTMAARVPVVTWQAIRLAWQASRPDTIAAVGLNLVAGVATGLGLLATRGVAEALLAAGPTPDRVAAAVPSLILVGAAMAARSGLGVGAGWAQARLVPKVTIQAERELFERSTEVALAAFDDDAFNDDVRRARARGTRAAAQIVEHAVNLITGVVGVIAVAGALVVVHPLLLPVLILAFAPTWWAGVRVARQEYSDHLARIARRRRMWILEELMADRGPAAEIRSHRVRDWLLGHHRLVADAEIAADVRLAGRNSLVQLLGGVLGGVAGVFVYVVLGLLLVSGAVPLAAAATAVLALQTGRSALRTLTAAGDKVFEEGLYFGDFTHFQDSSKAYVISPSGTRTRVGAPAVIELEKATLRYPNAERDAVHAVSLTIHKGETIALVGENGSGKTTLAKLLACLYAPTEGRMRWDGTDVTDQTTDEMRRHVAVISQDYQRWPFTASENIHIGTRPADDAGEDVVRAARAAGAHDMITRLPSGYATLLDRRFHGGSDLSGGQWQRLAAARGFFRDAPLLICDEPSSALDARAEHALFQQLRTRAGRATTVLITHRLANVRHADAIYVLHDGELVEQGTHDELMAEDGRYAELFTLQASGYRK